ncbi:MAG: adenylosuccinate lyase [Bacteroidales bacterium]|nr:adenylosuccinate lyase [Bacteroidales bacterium]
MNTLNAVSPIDGRYRSKAEPLAAYFSEGALIRYRVRVEVEYFIALAAELTSRGLWNQADGALVVSQAEALRDIYLNFVDDDALAIKEIEKTTNHDVKAVEYFLKGRFDQMGLSHLKEFIHFGLTSQDVNNTAVPLSMKEAHRDVLMPALNAIQAKLDAMAAEWREVPMLAHTHGQPASPTTLGKEVGVFAYRLRRQLQQLENMSFGGKFGGATGNFNAHLAAYPEVDWRDFANRFLSQTLGLERQQLTTQIENYDTMAAYFDACKRTSVILIDLCRDVWTYVSMDYFKQRIKAGEVGSSAMPHKVNPIDFENAEGNLGLAIAILEHLSHKLPVSRMQRDLTDSTVTRNIGVPLAHMLIALASLEKGLGKLILNEQALYDDLERNWAVVAEAIQTVLRSVGYPNPYEALKQLTRTGERVSAQTIETFVEGLNVAPEVKERLKRLTPHNYLGYKL